HLLLKIEGTAELQRLGFCGPDARAKICEVRAPYGQSGAGHHATAVVAKEHPSQHRREIDRRGVQRQEAFGSSRALNPIDMLRRALLQENGNALTRIGSAPAELLQLRFYYFVISAFNNIGYARLKCGQPCGNRVGNK